MFKQIGRFETQNASRYLGQLCKHFAHKVDVEYDANKGAVAFPFGTATLHASDDLLSVYLTGQSDEALARARSVVDVHLKTFAFREEFERMDWQGIEEAV